MSIVLRTNKGSALTYDEMDRNQSQFFYSSSKSPDGLKLRLHYTGSDNLDTAEDFGPTRYHEVSFPVFESEVPDSNVAGDNSEIQFNRTVSGISNFAAKPTFVFTENNNSVGIGANTPSERLEIRGDGARGGNIALRGSVNNEGEVQSLAGVKFYSGLTDATLLGQVGRLEFNSNELADDIYIHSGDFNPTPGFAPDVEDSRSVHISLGGLTPNITPASRIGATFKRTGSGETTVGINNSIPNLNLSVVGNSGVGLSDSSLEANYHSRLKPILSSNLYHLKVNGIGAKVLVPNNSTGAGLEISSPSTANGGNILMVINTDTQYTNEGFNIITTTESSAANATLLATFQASGKVGIGTNFPSHTGLTIQEQLSVKGLEPGTSAGTKTLVATSTGLVQQIAAAPVPLGGIIMWSGTIVAIPDGWKLCDGNSTGYGITVPDLRNKFIVGAYEDSVGIEYPNLQGGATGGSENAVLVAHEHSLTVNQSNHGHAFRTSHEQGGRHDSTGFPNTDASGPFHTHTANTGNPSTMQNSTAGNAIGGSQANILGSSKANVTGKNAAGNTANTQTGANANLPPYYALAYIIYVGV